MGVSPCEFESRPGHERDGGCKSSVFLFICSDKGLIGDHRKFKTVRTIKTIKMVAANSANSQRPKQQQIPYLVMVLWS